MLYLSGEEEGSADWTNRKAPLELGSVLHIVFTNGSFSRQEAIVQYDSELLSLQKLHNIFSITLIAFFISNDIIC